MIKGRKGSVFSVTFDAAGGGSSGSAGGTDAFEDGMRDILEILKKTELAASSRAAQIAAVYRRAGMTLSEALTRAWADVKSYTDAMEGGADATAALAGAAETYLSGLDQIRRYTPAKTSKSSQKSGSSGTSKPMASPSPDVSPPKLDGTT